MQRIRVCGIRRIPDWPVRTGVWEAGEGFFWGGRVGNLPYLFEQRVIYFFGNVGQNLPELGEYPRARF